MTDTRNNNSPQFEVRKYPSLKLNALSNWCVLFTNVIVGFLLTPALVTHLGERRFGMWLLVSSLIGYFGLLRLGVGTGVLRHVPLFRGEGDKEKVNGIVSTGMVFYMGVGLVILIISWFFADSIADFFQGGRELKVLVQVVGLAAALECPSLILDTTIRSYERYVYINIIGVAVTIIRAFALLGCLLTGCGLVQMGWVVVIITFLGLLAKGIAFRICCSDITLGLRKMNLSLLKLLLMYGLIIMLETGGSLLAYESPKQIAGKVISLEAVGLFGIAVLLMNYYLRLTLGLSQVLMPRFSYLCGRNAYNSIRRLFFRGTKYMVIIAAALALLLWSVGPAFLLLWIKEDHIKRAVPALVILTAGMLTLTSHRISVDLLLGLGKQKKLAVFAMVEGISVLGLSLVLAHRYGMAGVAIGASVPLILVRGFIQTKYVCWVIEVGFCKYYANFILKPWIIAITIAVGSYLLGLINLVNSWPSLFLVSGLIMLAYFAAVYMTAIGSEDKRRIKDRILAVVIN